MTQTCDPLLCSVNFFNPFQLWSYGRKTNSTQNLGICCFAHVLIHIVLQTRTLQVVNTRLGLPSLQPPLARPLSATLLLPRILQSLLSITYGSPPNPSAFLLLLLHIHTFLSFSQYLQISSVVQHYVLLPQSFSSVCLSLSLSIFPLSPSHVVKHPRLILL